MAFDELFEAVTGHAPFPWQRALYERFTSNRDDNIPAACQLPTGLGKTSVIAIWLIALWKQRRDGQATRPRRLVYVVNRRTVVDQTTQEAEKLKAAVEAGVLPGIDDLAISTLRGQFADNREWSADPSRPAIICGTVDMIGSRLLFNGYRIGFRSRPLHAGFLGQDALLVHDEAHLEPAFQKLIKTIQCEQKRERERTGELPWPGLRVMALSATTREDLQTQQPPLTLTQADHQHAEIRKRTTATKALHLHPCGEERKDLVGQLVERTLAHGESGKAVLVFARRVVDALDVLGELEKHHPDRVAPLTGTMRGHERDLLVRNNPVFARFMPESDRSDGVPPAQGTVYLVCTSAGEVGVNLSADHIVCDLSTFDSMAQRLGRVNRFGERDDTRIDVVHPESFDEKNDVLAQPRQATLDLLQRLDGDASPKALGDLMDTLSDKERKKAFAPEPTIPQATDILFDAWAMTTITDQMPGRPPVEPYLHGIDENAPQVTLTWRAEVDLLHLDKLGEDERQAASKALAAIFAKHRIRPHETITTAWYHVAEFLKSLARKHGVLADTPIALYFNRGGIRFTTLGQLASDPGPLRAQPTLVLPASLNLLQNGLLSSEPLAQAKKAKPSRVENAGDETAEPEEPAVSLDVADMDGYEPEKDASTRLRLLIQRDGETWIARPLPLGSALPDGWDFEPTEGSSTQLVNAIKRTAAEHNLGLRLVQPVRFDEEGNAVQSLVCLAPRTKADPKERQPLDEHIDAVESDARRLTDRLTLVEPCRSALLFAAKWHDEGKHAPIWQRYIGGPDDKGNPLGKSAEWRDPQRLAGYRHEFGSLLRLEHPSVWQTACAMPEDQDVKDLALHLIAAHHGYARPHFKNTIVEGFTAQQEEGAHIELMRRYARLQRRYGRWGLAYLESLLRAADAAASRAVGIDPVIEDDDTEAGES